MGCRVLLAAFYSSWQEARVEGTSTVAKYKATTNTISLSRQVPVFVDGRRRGAPCKGGQTCPGRTGSGNSGSAKSSHAGCEPSQIGHSRSLDTLQTRSGKSTKRLDRAVGLLLSYRPPAFFRVRPTASRTSL